MKLLKQIQTPYIDAQTLLTLFHAYKKPREKILNLVNNGELVRLRNGFYLISDKLELSTIPFEQIANMLYGPSYVSLEWALSFYGVIPERVHTVTSMTLGRSKEYHTSIGDFAYYPLHTSAYSIGISQKKNSNTIGGFLMATLEKTLADFVYKKCTSMNHEELKIELLESMRIDRDCFHHLDKDLLEAIAKNYRSKRVRFLKDLVGVL